MFKKIIYTILSIQEKILRKKLSKTIGVKNISKRKRHYSQGCRIDLNMLADSEKEKLEQDITAILKENSYDPTKILEYIKKQGTLVIFNNNSEKLLNAIGENEGFIYPTMGSKALYLSLAFKQKIEFNLPELFILSSNKNLNKYYFIYHFYNWFAFKHNISGVDVESQNLLKKYLFNTNNTKDLQLEEIYKLKDAITQDKAAIEFVVKLCRTYEGTKQALEKINTNSGANL